MALIAATLCFLLLAAPALTLSLNSTAEKKIPSKPVQELPPDFVRPDPRLPPPPRPKIFPDDTFDAEGCRANNTFVLANGVRVDNYAKHCACPEQNAKDKNMINNGVVDLNPTHCNPDGTKHCAVTGHPMGHPTRWCVDYLNRPTGIHNITNCSAAGYCKGACVRLFGKDPKVTNVGKCPCSEANQQETIPFRDAAVNGTGYSPQCNADGSWKTEQSGFGGTWTVDANGNQVSPIVFPAAGKKSTR